MFSPVPLSPTLPYATARDASIVHMDQAKPRYPERRRPAGGRPASPTLIDYEIRALGGTTTAFDTLPEEVQRTKDPVSLEDRIVELTIQNGRLRREIEYYKKLVNEVLHPVMALVQFHVRGLHSAVRKFNAKIELSNALWQDQE